MSLQLALDSRVAPSGLVYPVRVSQKWLVHKFRCDVDYITGVCHGRCCEGTGRVLISLLPSEEAWQNANGFKTSGGLLSPDVESHKCPHKTTEGLCRLHGTPNKPFGCIVSPFNLNKEDTLIIRHRYSQLKCHNADNSEPAFKTFKDSLILLFGRQEYNRLTRSIRAGNTTAIFWMPIENYRKLKYLDGLKGDSG